MKIQQLQFNNQSWEASNSSPGFEPLHCNLVLAFGDVDLIADRQHYHFLQNRYPNASIVLSSTSGEIMDGRIFEHSIVATAIQLEKSRISAVESNINQHQDSRGIGYAHFKQLFANDLKSIFIISDGIHINGSDLVTGFNECNDTHLPITGGLAGDAARFNQTFVGLNKVPAPGNVVSIGFY